jgi:hypothetical protein
MQVVRYVEPEHREMVDAWCRAWEMATFPPGWLPEVGFIAPGVAALWVYRTDSRVLFVENVISSPDAEDADRARALDALTEAVMAYAREMGGAYLVGQSSIPSVWRLAKRHGWNVGSETLRQVTMRVEGG